MSSPAITTAASAASRPPGRTAVRVLVADDNELQREITVRLLELCGMECLTAPDGRAAAELAWRERPDVVLLDSDMPVPGSEGLALIRGDHRTTLTPVIFVTADSRPESIVEHLLGGADDYVTKPFTADELEARIRVAIRRRAVLGSVNPLTGLAGNVVLTGEVERRLRTAEPFALLHIDLDDFKPYNDRYGYVRGDTAIMTVATVLREIADTEVARSPGLLLAHIGGDDFAAIVPVEAATRFAEAVLHGFSAARGELHDPDDVLSGRFTALDRSGRITSVPLLALSIGLTTSENGPFGSASEMADAAAELKRLAKQTDGPSLATDRRRHDER